jgi:TPR repeat protein
MIKRNRNWRVPLALLVAAIVGATPPAIPLLYQRGLDEYSAHRYSNSRYWLLLPAHFGNNAAQALLGTLYALGDGVNQDGPAAMYWLDRAAEAGVVEAQAMIGTLYATGTLTPQNPEKAIFWLSKAAAKGDREASAFLRLYRSRSGSI